MVGNAATKSRHAPQWLHSARRRLAKLIRMIHVGALLLRPAR